MRFGHFDDARKEYVITTPRTPLPWINYLGCEHFFSLISHTAGGYSFYRDAKLLRLTRYRYNNTPADSEGHRIYLKEGDTVWNPGWQPTQTELDSYRCRHGMGYSIFEGTKNGLSAVQEHFVPLGDPCEVIRLRLKNTTGQEKRVQVFPYLEFCLWNAVDDSTNFQRNYSTGEVEVEPGAIYHKTEYRERRNHYAVFAVIGNGERQRCHTGGTHLVLVSVQGASAYDACSRKDEVGQIVHEESGQFTEHRASAFLSVPVRILSRGHSASVCRRSRSGCSHLLSIAAFSPTGFAVFLHTPRCLWRQVLWLYVHRLYASSVIRRLSLSCPMRRI